VELQGKGYIVQIIITGNRLIALRFSKTGKDVKKLSRSSYLYLIRLNRQYYVAYNVDYQYIF